MAAIPVLIKHLNIYFRGANLIRGLIITYIKCGVEIC